MTQMTKDDIIDIVYLAAIVEAHSEKFPVPTHASALAKRVVSACRETMTAEAQLTEKYETPERTTWIKSVINNVPKDRPVLAAWSSVGDPVSYGVVEYNKDDNCWEEGGVVVIKPDLWMDFEKL